MYIGWEKVKDTKEVKEAILELNLKIATEAFAKAKEDDKDFAALRDAKEKAEKALKDGVPWVLVIFESGNTGKYPKKMYDAMLTIEKSDDSALRDRRVMKVMKEYIDILLTYDLTFKEIESLGSFVQNFLAEKKAFATAKIFRPLMTNPLPAGIHPTRTIEALSIGDVDRILDDKQNPNAAK